MSHIPLRRPNLLGVVQSMSSLFRKRCTAVVCIILFVYISIGPYFLGLSYATQQPGSKPVSALEIISGRYEFNFVADQQWFKVYMKTGQTISILLTVPDRASLDLYLYSPDVDPDGITGQVASSDEWRYSGGNESIVYVAGNEGFHYIKIMGARYIDPATYELKVFVTEFKVISTYWGEGLVKSSAFPGDSNVPLTIEVGHYANHAITILTTTLQLVYPFSNTLKTDMAVSLYKGQIEQGGTASFTFTLNIDSKAELKIYGLTLLIDYYVKDSDDLIWAIPVEVSVFIPLLGRPEIDILSDSSSLMAGQVNDLSLKFRNIGNGTASSVEGTFTLPSGLTLVNGSNQFRISKLEPSKDISKRLNLRVSESLASPNIQISVQISYKDGYGQPHSESKIIELQVKTPPVFISVVQVVWGPTTNPTPVGPGDKAVTLSIMIRNTEAYTISDITAYLDLAHPFTNITGGDVASTYYSGSILSGQNAILQFTLNIDDDAIVGVHHLTLVPEYLYQGSLNRGEDVNVDVLLPGRANLVPTVTNDVLTAGSTNQLKIRISNIGSGEVYSLTASLASPSAGSFVFDLRTSQQTFGIVTAGQEVSFDVNVEVSSSTQPGLYQTQLSITYKDIYGQTQVENWSIGLKVQVPEARLVVTTEGQSLTAEQVNNLTLLISNQGVANTYSLEVSVTIPSPLLLAGKDDKWYINSLAVDEEVSLTIQVFAPISSKDNTYTAKLNIAYEAPEGLSKSYSTDISLSVPYAPPEPILKLEVSQQSLRLGAVNNLLISIINEGQTSADDLQVVLNLPTSLFMTSLDNVWLFDALEARGKTTLTVQVYVPPTVVAGTFSEATLELTYQASGLTKVEKRTIRFLITPALEVSEFLYALYTHMLTAPDENVKFPVKLTNPLDTLQNVDLAIDAPKGWNYSVLSGSSNVLGLSLIAKQSIDLQVSVDVPSDAEDGVYELVFTANSRGFNLTLPVKVTVSRAIASLGVQIELSASNPYQEAYGGRTVNYNLIVTNNNADESELVDLAMNGLPNGFSASFKNVNGQDVRRIYVDAGSQASFALAVVIPETSTISTVPFNVTATARGDSVALPLTLEVVGQYSLSIRTQNLFKSVTIGSTGSYSITAENDGTQDLTTVFVQVTEDLIPEGMTISLSPDSIAVLRAGEVATFTFEIESETDLSAGTYLIPFILNSDQTTSSQSVLTVQAVQSSDIIWIGAGVVIAGIVVLIVIFRKFGRR